MVLILLILFLPWMEGLNQNQEIYLQNCPSQNVSLPCTPAQIDEFISSQLKDDLDIHAVLSKVYIPGVCYHERTKYCPTELISCNNSFNHGYNFSIKGECISKHEKCSLFHLKDSCQNLVCNQSQYLCHPKGCIPLNALCNGRCLPLKKIKSSLHQPSNTSTKISQIHKHPEYYERRIKCGNSCLSRDESKNLYDCGGECKNKSEPCRDPGENICPQHYILCGADTCIDKFEHGRVLEKTGFPEYFSCSGVCTPASKPCRENNTLHCQNGYWMCKGKEECILQEEIGREGSVWFTQLCDGIPQCKDGSDESASQCFKVYSLQISITCALLFFLLPSLAFFICYYRNHLTVLISKLRSGITQRDSVQDKSYLGNEDEMFLRGVAPEDVD
ncbi:low-density lipoprotein receptor-related protein 2 [Eurytemora carolleeae]|uniref:low-density lipoprotein receptor-related protein 2 n=1 Tax=Eurytemora carolleeae TaxID=1294199 RepID=UPI000C76F02E|nr:low-density lipoprotein receptor-related protein 2 [Eurytemora carolleeae]|eukprot:XP_023345971.1 low-density lipoprotein receptor-related protein 2-like [Eurytemora affinis]